MKSFAKITLVALLTIGFVSCGDTIHFDPESILEDMQSDELEYYSNFKGQFRWDFSEATAERYENMDSTTLEVFENIFVRLKGLHEGMYRGFYHNSSMMKNYDDKDCLGNDSYDDLDVIAGAVEHTFDG